MVRKLFAFGWFAFFAWLISTGGCAALHRTETRTTSPAAVNAAIDESAYTDAVAASLAFEPLASIESATLDLSREPRQPAAFIGFEEQTETHHYLQVDNHQGRGGDRDGFDRHDYIDRYGVSYR